MDQQRFLWKGSLLPLLLLAILLLCKNVTSHTPCPTGVDNCVKILQEFFDGAVMQSQNMNELASQFFTALHKEFSTAPWYFAENIGPCHTASITSPELNKEAKTMSSSELFSLARLILRSWMDPLAYLSWQTQGTSYRDNTLIQLELQSMNLLKGMDDIADKVDPSIKENKDYIPWVEFPALQLDSEQISVRPSFYVARCMMKDSDKISNYMRILQCRYYYVANCDITTEP